MAVDRHGLRLAGIEPPQVGHREADGAQRRRSARPTRHGEAKRVLAVAEAEQIVGALLAAEQAQYVVGKSLAHLPAMISVSSVISTSGQVMCGLWLASIS